MPIPQLKTRRNVSWKEEQKNNRRPVKRQSNKRYSSKNKRNLKKLLFQVVIYGFIFCLLAGTVTILWLSKDLPNPNQLIDREVAQSTKIYDRSGENIIYEISGEEKRTLVKLDDLPDYVKNATIAIEDKNFYKHGGFSVWAMFRTMITNVIYHRSAGGSTLTQQFIKNAVLSNEKTIVRKLKELILAYKLEKRFSKDEILQMYLNEIPYGSNAYGIEAASQKYFGKNSRDLSIAEAALLAALPQSPSRYSPYGANKDLLLGRKDYILEVMAEQGYISEEERDIAKQEELVFKGRDNNITAPHFVMYIKGILSEKYGEKMIEQGGLKIYTTLDLYKQKIAEEIITEKTENYPEKYKAENAALVAIDPKTGEILAMVGSRDYFNDEIDGQVNVTIRPRQPGSSMKPIVYAALFEKGYTPNTILYDVKTNFSTNPNEPYSPNNYDGQERGPVTIRQALAGSLNIPAVKAIYLADINTVLDLTDNLGYTTLYPRNRFGLSLVLGGGEVKMIEHVNAYSAFARDGKVNSIISILKVEDKDGHILEEAKPQEKKVLDSQVARMINSILSDNAARSYVFGEKNSLTLGGRPVAAKTGTTNNFRDAWTIGYTPSLVTGVWVGNSDNKEMSGKADGSVIAAPIWQEFMKRVLGDTPFESFKEPDDYTTGKAILDGEVPSEKVKIDKSSGLLASDLTPWELIEEINVPSHHSILFYVEKDDPRGETPKNPENDPQFKIWEEAIKKWTEENSTSSAIVLPDGYSENHLPENKPELEILYPQNNETITSNNLEIKILASAKRGINRTEYYLNNNLWQTKLEKNETLISQINFLSNGYHNLKVRVCDDVLNCEEKSLNFNLLIKDNPVINTKNSLTITYPSSGLALNSNDFPLPVSFSVKQSDRISQIKFFLKDESEKTTHLQTIIDNISTNNSLSINSSPPPGTYHLFGELYDWNGDVIKSEETVLVIN